MELSCQFANLGCKAIEKKIVEGDEYTFIEYLPIKKWEESNQLVAQHVLEGMLAFAIREMRQLTKLTLNDLLVNLSYKPLDKLSEYNRVLNCPISFGAKTNSIRIPNEVMKAPIVSSNFDLLRVLVQHAELKLNELQKLDSWENRVNKMILYLSDIPSISIDQVAMLLGTSARTLQRKLKDEGLKFQFLLDQYKIGLCNYYLEKTDHAIKEIAYELGYNDSSAFIRFYKKHTGMSPSQVRV